MSELLCECGHSIQEHDYENSRGYCVKCGCKEFHVILWRRYLNEEKH